jgi:hypothetical protein
MQDVLQQLGKEDDQGRAVVKDSTSRAAGPNPAKASVVKILLDSFADKLQTAGLRLGSVGIRWETDDSADQVADKLRQMHLIPERSLSTG